jgi:hypothetical protein
VKKIGEKFFDDAYFQGRDSARENSVFRGVTFLGKKILEKNLRQTVRPI